MSKGTFYPSEAIVSRDEVTGRPIRQITAQPCIHHHPFFYVPAYDQSMRWLLLLFFPVLLHASRRIRCLPRAVARTRRMT